VIDPHDCLRPRPRGRCVCGPRKLPKPSPTGWPAPTSCSVSASPVIGQRQTKMLARRAPTGTMTLGNRRGFGPRVPRSHVQSCDDPATVQVDDWPNETTVACFGLRIVRHRHGHSSIKATEVYPKHLTSEEQLRERGFAARAQKAAQMRMEPEALSAASANCHLQLSQRRAWHSQQDGTHAMTQNRSFSNAPMPPQRRRRREVA
jgi:hypothetical protein